MSKSAVYEFVARADSDPEVAWALRGASGVPGIVRVAGERGLSFTPGELAPVVELLRFLDETRRNAWLRGALASASDHAAIVALARQRGYAFSAEELAHLNVEPVSRQLDEQDLERVVGGAPVGGVNKIDALVFKMGSAQQGSQAGSVLAAAAIAASFIPGGAVVLAAISGAPPKPGAG
jgi:predicted ribosomally synthesized peptide with nif11-like leader